MRPDDVPSTASEPEPERWRCEGCGEEFDEYRFSHGKAEHARSCDGYKCGSDCPVEVECGPITKVTPVPPAAPPADAGARMRMSLEDAERENMVDEFVTDLRTENDALAARVKEFRELLKEQMPFEVAQGDMNHRLSPGSAIHLNTAAAWVVGQHGRSAIKLKGWIERLARAMEEE